MPPEPGAPGGIHHRDLRVRVGRRPRAVAAQRDPRRLDVALGQVLVLGLHEQADVHRRIARRLEAARSSRRSGGWPSRRSRARPPGGSGRSACRPARRASRAARPVAPTTKPGGQGQRDVVDAEVGEELGRGVELVRVPRALPEDADLGEPLRDEVVVVDPARAAERRRRGCATSSRCGSATVAPGGTGRGVVDLHHRAVVGVAVVGLDVAEGRREVGLRRAVAGERDPAAPACSPSAAASPPRGRPAAPARGPTSRGCSGTRSSRGGTGTTTAAAPVVFRHSRSSWPSMRWRSGSRRASIV